MIWLRYDFTTTTGGSVYLGHIIIDGGLRSLWKTSLTQSEDGIFGFMIDALQPECQIFNK